MLSTRWGAVIAVLWAWTSPAPTRQGATSGLAWAGEGAAGGQFLVEDLSARPFALGGAFSALADGPAVLGVNPGGLDALVYPEVTAAYRKGALDAAYQQIGYAHPLRRGWALGAILRRYDGGTLEVNYLDGRQETVKAQEDWAASVLAGRAVGEWVSVGAGAKIIRSSLAGQYAATAVAGDVGLLVRTLDDQVGFGLALLDAGSGLTYKSATEPLPTRVRTGLAWRPFLRAAPATAGRIRPPLLLGGDVVWPLRAAASLHLGGELEVAGGASLRVGVNRTGSDTRLTAGFGVRLLQGQLDYGFGQAGQEAAQHQVSLSWRLGTWRPFDIASRYYEKGQPHRAMAWWARVPTSDPLYAQARRRVEATEQELEMARLDRLQREAEVRARARMVAEAKAAPIQVAAAEIPMPPLLVISTATTLRDANGNGVLEAGEAGSLVVKVLNESLKGTARDVRLRTEALGAPWLTVADAEVRLGDIPPQGHAIGNIALLASEDAPTAEPTVSVRAVEANGNDVRLPLTARFQTRAVEPPRLEVRLAAVDDTSGAETQGNGNRAAEPGETVLLLFQVTNAGAGKADQVALSVVLPQSLEVSALRSRDDSIGDLASGQGKTASVAVSLKPTFPGKSLGVTVRLQERRPRFSRQVDLVVPVREPVGGPGVTVSAAAAAYGAAGGLAIPGFVRVADVDTVPAIRPMAERPALAVVIGVESYREVPRAQYAVRDAQAVNEYIRQGFGVEEKNIRLLLNHLASRSDLEKVLEDWLPAQARALDNPRVFVFFAGHGAPDPEKGDAYLLPYDGDPNYLKRTGYPLRRLYQTLEALPTKDVLVMVDACFSGGGGRSVLAKGARPLVVERGDPLAGPGGVTVLAAAGASQITQSLDAKSHGLFTYYLLKGLGGDADGNRDRQVSLGELYDYLRRTVPNEARRMSQHDQEPQMRPGLEALKSRATVPLVRVP